MCFVTTHTYNPLHESTCLKADYVEEEVGVVLTIQYNTILYNPLHKSTCLKAVHVEEEVGVVLGVDGDEGVLPLDRRQRPVVGVVEVKGRRGVIDIVKGVGRLI